MTSVSPLAIETPMALGSIFQAQASPADDSQEHLLAVGDIEAGGDDPQTKFRIRNLTKKSDAGVTILGGVNLDIPKGVVVGIIGPSGSGKSTLLRSLNRLWEPPSDAVFLDGRDIRDLDVLSLRRKVGMLFQIPALFEGQAQRVALARTLANEPEVLLLDEPTSALDPISTQNIEDAIVKLKKSQGMTIVMVSHSIKQIQRIADVVCLLVNGEVVEVLKPDELSQAKHPMAQSSVLIVTGYRHTDAFMNSSLELFMNY
ncbi:hypothetical protein GH714_040445 [Hevea brasiliensis]|uniref:ABC transporter domain-containing protein n=1 Tax=Hevea brasiliensis TaxID=3981 RepID=A0A6A6L7B7_HEVBR|nr:hypothetical protein GH714_040445 [Hevea brasiliensis]